MALTIHTTPACRYCDRTTDVVVDLDTVDDLLYIERELVVNGTHADCADNATRFALAVYGSSDGGIDD